MISLWMEATPSILLSCTLKSLENDVAIGNGAQIHADVNVTLHDVLGRSVMDSLASVPTTPGWNKKQKQKENRATVTFGTDRGDVSVESTWVKSI